MGSTVTVTGKTGPAQAVSALTMTDVRLIQIAPAGAPNASTLKVTLANGQVRDFDLAASTTVTATISTGTIALVISQ